MRSFYVISLEMANFTWPEDLPVTWQPLTAREVGKCSLHVCPGRKGKGFGENSSLCHRVYTISNIAINHPQTGEK